MVHTIVGVDKETYSATSNVDPKRQRIDALDPEKPGPRTMAMAHVPPPCRQEELPNVGQMAAMVGAGSKVKTTCAAKSAEAVIYRHAAPGGDGAPGTQLSLDVREEVDAVGACT